MNSNFMLNFGPQHPAAHGVLRLILELDGETIVAADPHIGFLHRGTEKLIENRTYKQAIPYFDRLDYVSMLAQEHAFVLAIEYLLNIDTPITIQYIRVLFDELTRILNHIMCITTHALDVGALTPFLWGFEERERVLQFYELLTGARMHAAFYSIGSHPVNIPSKLLDDIYLFTVDFFRYIDVLDDLLSRNPIWQTRLSDVGFISKDRVLAAGLSGPVSRGSGIPWDIRKTQPYEVYKNLFFKIPVGLSGDSMSRYKVRLIEMRESVSIIQQCLSYLVAAVDGSNKVLQPTHSDVCIKSKYSQKLSMEETINQFKFFSSSQHISSGSVYTAIEAPKGETGVWLVADGTAKPYRCKIKAPGFLHLQALEVMSKNFFISDVVTNIGSLDIVFGEIDR